MRTLMLYAQVLISAALIVWGCEWLPRLAISPEAAASWIGPVLILAGAGIGARVVYVAREGAAVLGSILLAFAGLYAWNLHYYFDPDRVPGGAGPPTSFYWAPSVLIVLGVLFVAFFRYVYPTGPTASKAKEAGGAAPAESHRVEPPTRSVRVPPPSSGESVREKSAERFTAVTPWYRLLMLVAAAGVALLAGHFSGVDDPAARARIIILVLVLGCLATGLISESTLTKLVPWKKS